MNDSKKNKRLFTSFSKRFEFRLDNPDLLRFNEKLKLRNA